MVITDAKYLKDIEGENTSVQATVDNKLIFVPLVTANRHYAEILKQVADGDITIAAAD